MKIHEFQAKDLLEKFKVPVLNGIIASNLEEAIIAFEKLGKTKVVIKAQVHAGGRGKGGGVKFAENEKELEKIINIMLNQPLITSQTGAKGVKVNKVLISKAVGIKKEFYLGMVIDREKGPVFIASAEGGMEIEEIAHKHPDKIFKEFVDKRWGLLPFQAARLAYKMGFKKDKISEIVLIMQNIVKAFFFYDCSLIEINPLVQTIDDKIMAIDAKINLDDNAIFRHKIYETLDDKSEIDSSEIRAKKSNLSYIKLDGNIGCMVNGAGLAMATMDIIKAVGGEPANFLDVGGAVKEEGVKEGFKIILSDTNVKAILVNIFGGIVKCDLVARGILNAIKEIETKCPIVVRLEGTNVKEAKELLNNFLSVNNSLNIIVADDMQDAAEKIVEIARSNI